ncbi:craniofacial development protein 2-like [Patiria miniata]|uniref:Endonuclease/exonuclease/phosphatase domain-containing protein n=1 Tax=Patiria miniata TaxID=46514 RepID=A0A913ZVR8_PATMI|nr:craniofacial development protein 2-like [Patiria miniata]
MKKSNSTRVKAPTNRQTPLPQSLQVAEHHDASIPNPIGRNDGPPTAGRTPDRAPIGRTVVDTPDGKRAFLNAKCTISIGTWNVRTLHQEGNLEHLLHELSHLKWEVIGLSETHLCDSGELRQEGIQFLCSGNDTTHREGVAILLNKAAQRALIGYNPISERIITARLHTQIGAITIIQIYAPTSASSDEDIDSFYDQLQQAINQIPSQDIQIVMVDFNAKVGTDWESWNGILGKFGLGDANDRGERLLNFCALNDLCISNTLFKQKKDSREWTWESPDGNTRNKIDFILINRRWKSSISMSRSFPSADIGSDHQLVHANMKLRLKAKPKSARQTRFDIEKLKDKNVREAFKVRIGGRFEPLLNATDTDVDAEVLWDGIKSSFQETSRKSLVQ